MRSPSKSSFGEKGSEEGANPSESSLNFQSEREAFLAQKDLRCLRRAGLRISKRDLNYSVFFAAHARADPFYLAFFQLKAFLAQDEKLSPVSTRRFLTPV